MVIRYERRDQTGRGALQRHRDSLTLLRMFGAPALKALNLHCERIVPGNRLGL